MRTTTDAQPLEKELGPNQINELRRRVCVDYMKEHETEESDGSKKALRNIEETRNFMMQTHAVSANWHQDSIDSSTVLFKKQPSSVEKLLSAFLDTDETLVVWFESIGM